MLQRERAHHCARLGARREPHAAAAAMAAVVLVEGCAVGLLLVLLVVVGLQDDGERCDQRRQLDWLVVPGGG